jgi:very-short-patch-repair endonuclease
MPRLFGPERLAEQVGNYVADRVYRWSTTSERYFVPTPGTTPIEKLLFHSLEAYCEYSDVEPHMVILCRTREDFAEAMKRKPTADVYVEQQVELGNWRADFIVHRYDWICEKWRHLIVECDGHEYHERTKEQASRDRARDRRASIQGATLLRFTGSEIWGDPLGCAREVFDWFAAESNREKTFP